MIGHKLLLQMGWVLSTFLLLSCSEEQTHNDKQPITIGLVHCCDKKDVFMDNVRAQIELAAKEAGQIRVLFRNSEGQQEKQNQQIEQLLNQGVDVLVVSMVDHDPKSSSGAEVVELVKNSKVPIIFYNRGVDSSILSTYDQAYYVGSIPAQAGILQGEQVITQWRNHPEWDRNGNQTIEYVLLRGPDGDPEADARSTWVEATMQHYPNLGIKTHQLASASSSDWSRKQGRMIMREWLAQSRGKQIELVVANNDDMAIGAIDALKSFGLQLPVFGIDTIDEARNLVQQGRMTGTILQNAVAQGHEIINLAKNLGRGENLRRNTTYKIVNQQLIIPYVIVDSTNVGNL